MRNDSIVYLSRAAYNSLLVSAIEVYSKETEGVLVGSRTKNGKFKIDYAHPYQTSDRGFAWVQEGNGRASARVKRLLSALNGRPGSPHIIGGYHSHPCKKGVKIPVSPSTNDLKTIREEQLPVYHGLDSWLELIVRVSSPFIEKAHTVGAVNCRRLKKISTTAYFDNWHAYQFLTGAFLVHPDKERGYDELRLELA